MFHKQFAIILQYFMILTICNQTYRIISILICKFTKQFFFWQYVKPEAPSAVVRSWWWAERRPKLVEPHINVK
jgi:hypothetical protein